jgi:hypothetical protein
MAICRATRAAAADPASVALLLSGPTATELFADTTGGAVIDVTPPRRAGVGFTAALLATDGDDVAGRGSLTVQPGLGGGATVTAVLYPVRDSDAARWERRLTRCVARLAEAARERSSAA